MTVCYGRFLFTIVFNLEQYKFKRLVKRLGSRYNNNYYRTLQYSCNQIHIIKIGINLIKNLRKGLEINAIICSFKKLSSFHSENMFL